MEALYEYLAYLEIFVGLFTFISRPLMYLVCFAVALYSQSRGFQTRGAPLDLSLACDTALMLYCNLCVTLH